jgi:hypothetical protein
MRRKKAARLEMGIDSVEKLQEVKAFVGCYTTRNLRPGDALKFVMSFYDDRGEEYDKVRVVLEVT